MGVNMQDYIQTSHSGNTFEKVCGRGFWKRILKSYVPDETTDEALQLETSQAILLYGPFGAGKTTLLYAQAGEMISAGYQYLEVDLRDIPDGRMPELCEEILEYCAKGPCYLYLDHIEDLSDGMPLWELSAQAAEDKNCLTMVATAEEARTLNPVIRKLFQTYYVGLPDASDRRSYLDEMLQSRFEHPSLQGMNLLVDGTEGFNYLEMDALINQIKLQIKYRIQNHEITVEQAVNIMDRDILEEVLAMKKPEERKNDGAGISDANIAALMQMVASAKAAPPVEEPEEKIERAPRDLLEDLDPDAVFDQGLYF